MLETEAFSPSEPTEGQSLENLAAPADVSTEEAVDMQPTDGQSLENLAAPADVSTEEAVDIQPPVLQCGHRLSRADLLQVTSLACLLLVLGFRVVAIDGPP